MNNDTLWEALNAREREIEDLEDEVKALRGLLKALRGLLKALRGLLKEALFFIHPDQVCPVTGPINLHERIETALAAGRESK